MLWEKKKRKEVLKFCFKKLRSERRTKSRKQVAIFDVNTLTNYCVGILEPSFSKPPQLRTNTFLKVYGDGVLLTVEVHMSVAAFLTTDSGIAVALE